jgi:CRISPR-associated protein Cas2
MILVVYDISDDKRRYRVSELLKDFGLKRIQRSAFIGDLTIQERKDLIELLSRYVRDKSDRIDIFFICIKDLKMHRKITPEGISDEL